ncbi:MAG: ATP-dependent DNA helicase UvrD2 [Acidimicrobiia bacterium]
MTAPGPIPFGRSVVVGPDGSPPAPWSGAPLFAIDDALLGDVDRLGRLVAELQRRYVRREPAVFQLAVDAAALTAPESDDRSPFELGAGFSFLRERLARVVWHNSYDARDDSLVWWWAHKAAARFGVEVGGPADVVAADGEKVWVDGGPRQAFELDDPVIHYETVDIGRWSLVPSSTSPPADLAPDQLEAVSHAVGPARIIAPAGSGKTRVLTERLRHVVEDRGLERETVLALAYNKRAADEMASRLPGGLAGCIRTIHSLGWEILRMARPGISLIDEREQRRRLEAMVPAPRRANTDVIGPYLEALDEVRIGLQTPDEVEGGRDDVPGLGEVFARYREGLERRNEADHAEQIYGAIEALSRDPGFRLRWQSRCRHLLVDEFQDLTPAFVLLIRLLAAPGLDVFGVGDDDQVIYGYAGADPGFLIEFEELFPGAGAHALEVNYRCPVDVVESASTLLGYNLRRVEKTIHASSTESGLTVTTAPGDDLAVVTADRVAGLLDAGVSPTQVAVLTRVNSSLLPLHAVLSERGVPFDSPLTVASLDRTVVRGALAWVRLALDPLAMRRNDLFEAVRRPQRGITRLFGEMVGRRRGPFSLSDLIEMGAGLEGRRGDRWDQFCEDLLLASRSTGTTPELLAVLSDEVGLEKAAAALDAGRTRADRAAQGDDLTALRRVAAVGPGPAEFEAWLRRRLAPSTDPEGVTLSTVHRVKGLEWDHVFVFGADRGAMPHVLSGDVEEERRVFHVAMTRGRRTVTIVADEDRPSRFLTEIDGSAPKPSPRPAPADEESGPGLTGIGVVVGERVTVTGGFMATVVEILTTGVLVEVTDSGATMAIPWGERVVKSGRADRLVPGSGTAVGGDLLQRLKAWRLDQARSQGVPAYVVFSDKTLEALAALRPTTQGALLGVPGIGPAKLEAYGDDLLDLLG